MIPKPKPRKRKTDKWAVISKAYKTTILEDQGYLTCEACGTSNTSSWEVHHRVFRSELRGHVDKHHRRNLALLCFECHKKAHSNREFRVELVRQNSLWEIFEVAVKYMP